MAPIMSTPRPLTPGNVLFDTKPVIHVICDEFKGQYCDNCLNFGQMKKCSKCFQMYYCDKNCQQIDWKYHKNECKVFTNKSFKQNEVKWSERMLIRLWLTIKSDETFVTKRHKLFDGSDICLNDIEVKVKELSKDFVRMNEFLLICKHFEEYKIKFNGHLRCLIRCQFAKRKELLRWFGLITISEIRHELVYYSSSCEHKPIFSRLSPIIAIGLYPELSSVNHSCLPNSAVVTNGLSLQLRAIDEISVGTQITRSYVSLRYNKTMRNGLLKEDYLITGCKCDKCEQNLDSNEDYLRLQELLIIQNFNYQGRLVKPISKINIKQRVSETSEISSIGEKVLGPFHPYLSDFLLTDIMFRLQKTDVSVDPYFETLKKRYEKHLLITYGVNHPIYRNIEIIKLFLELKPIK